MAPKTKEQYAKIRQGRKETILDAALELFAGKGLTETTMQDIAKRAGISKGLIYNYFPSKDVLLHEIITTFINHLYDFFDPDNDGILTPGEMRYFLEKQVEHVKAHKDYWKFLYMLLIQPSAQAIMKKVQLAALTSEMWKMISNYMQQQHFEDPEHETWFFHTMLDGAVLNYVFNPETYPLDRMRDMMIRKYCMKTR